MTIISEIGLVDGRPGDSWFVFDDGQIYVLFETGKLYHSAFNRPDPKEGLEELLMEPTIRVDL